MNLITRTKTTNLVCSNEPLNCSLDKSLVTVWDDSFRQFLLFEVTIQGPRHLFPRLLALLDVTW